MQRKGGVTARNTYSPLYVEFDTKAVPYRFINMIRSQGAHYDTLLEVFTELRRSGRYYRSVELFEYGGLEDKRKGLRIRACLGKGIEIDQDPVGESFGERSSTFRHCRQGVAGTIQ